MRPKILKTGLAVAFSLIGTAFFINGSQSESISPKLLSGSAAVIDGDTISINNDKIRLYGIDAPEMTQSCSFENYSEWKCGEDAAAFLQGAIVGKNLYCTVINIDQYERYVAECYTDTRTNINSMMVLEGWAVNYDHYTDLYKADEIVAKEYERGIWAGSFQMPWEFRQEGS